MSNQPLQEFCIYKKKTMDYNKIIEKYYTPGTELYNIFMRHSRDVTRRALQIVDAHPELGADRQFVEEAAMLHDIGIVRCDAPGICCHGTEPYLRHGMIGAAMMREEGYNRHARVCERHTGAGLSAREIEQQDLPLPHRDFLPETIEEKIICYADKFYSKSHLDRCKTFHKPRRPSHASATRACNASFSGSACSSKRRLQRFNTKV